MVAYRVRQQIGRDRLPVEVAVQVRAKARARHALARGAERPVHTARRARPHEKRVKRRGGRHGHRAGNTHAPRAGCCAGWSALISRVVAFHRTCEDRKTAACRAPPPLFAAAAFRCPPRWRASLTSTRGREARRGARTHRAPRGRRRTRWRPRGSEPRRSPPRAPREEAVVVGMRRMRRRARPRMRPRRDRLRRIRDRDTESARKRQTRCSTLSARLGTSPSARRSR